MIQTLKLAWRNLKRNKRRSFFSALALGMGLALLLLIAGVVDGEYRGALESAINLQSGHLQVRAKTFDENKSSLAWDDLVEKPNDLAAQISVLAPVKVATPRLFASGFVAGSDQAVGIRIMGIDPASDASAPYKNGVMSGAYLTADDREGVLIGSKLAAQFNLKVGDRINLTVNTSNGDVDQQAFVVRGIYSTRTPSFDNTTVLMSLSKAQAITQAGDHASTIFVLLRDIDQTDAVRAALQTSRYDIRTWSQMNELVTQTEDLSRSYMTMLYLIVLAVTATVIVNTLIMAVFERTREIGILAAVGMRSGRIMSLFFAESALLAVGGIALGLLIGGVLVAYFTQVGFYIGDLGTTGIMISDTIHAHLTVKDTITLVIIAFVVTLLAALYPALMAARMQPVQALRGGKK
jgi:ABC-type lipoprotein release transport system permease subunit